MSSEVLSESVLESTKMVEAKNEIAAIRDRLQEAKKIHFAARQSWKEVGATKRQTDEALTKLATDGYGVPSAKELHDARVAKWAAMTSHIDALKKFIGIANEAADSVDEMIHHSKIDFLAWADRAIADVMAAMPGFSHSTASCRVAEQPQHGEGRQLLLDSQRQASAVRQLVKDALAAIETTEQEMREQSRRWRTV